MAFLAAGLGFVLMLLVDHVLLRARAHGEVHAPSGERFAQIITRHHDALGAYAVLTALSITRCSPDSCWAPETDLSRALVIWMAVLAHKWAEGFALGVSLAERVASNQARRLVALFALATPAGGLVGAILGASVGGRLGQVLEASFVSVAAGTFVYVATFDILRDEFPAHAADSRSGSC
ncbi:MAG: ZIP family metal transporter [Myxococcota bacterium]